MKGRSSRTIRDIGFKSAEKCQGLYVPGPG
jgi:hypothetical protein